MPRIQNPSQLHLVAKRAATLTSFMPAVACFSSLAASFPGTSRVDERAALSVACWKPFSGPQLDVGSRLSSADPATSSWDFYSDKIPSSRFSPRFCKGFSPSGLVYSLPCSRACVGRFCGLATGRNASGGNGDDAEDLPAAPKVPEHEDAARDGQSSSGEAEKEAAWEDESEKERLDRRRKGVLAIPNRLAPEWRDLLTVPGIGRRNMEKLVANGIAKLDELKQLYRDKYRIGGTDKMVEFLRSSVGVHKHHATSISTFIKNTVDAEEDGTAESGARPKKRLTFCVEGNISVGKTTFLHKIANETLELRDLVEVVPEPIGKWQDVGPNHFNILDAFYGDPERYAYTFQNYVFVTRMMQERESCHGDKVLRLMERSVFSDRMVFVRAVHEAKWMSDAEISIYDSWFDPVVSAMPGLIPDAFIYLRATPDTCLRRLQSRNREEEAKVTLDYLRGLHEKHEQWLLPTERCSSTVLSISELPSRNHGPLSPRLRDRVLYLEGENVHSSIRKVPALVLDCEPSIDFSRDVEAKAEYARQVAEFLEYVQGMKDNQPGGPDSSSLVLPRSGLLGPDGHLLQRNSLEGVDLRRQFSNLCA